MQNNFEKPTKYPQIVDEVVNKFFPCDETRRFSKVFHILFPETLEHNENIKSFIRIFDSFQNFLTPDFIERQIIDEIYERLGLTKIEDGVYHFWIYLIQVYQKVRGTKNRPNFDNVFAFMDKFPVEDVRVVIIGQDPSLYCESSGFAFHGSICESTKYIIGALNEELKLLDAFSRDQDSQTLTLSNVELDKQQQNCNLFGWIQQGVLMINAKLTFGENLWLYLTDFVVKMLSENCQNLVFILAGGVAESKRMFINQTKHVVISVYHPTHPSQNDERLKWNIRLPFINTNFYFHQISEEGNDTKHIIDWMQIDNFNDNQSSFSLKSKSFFKDLLITANRASRLTSQYAGEYVSADNGAVLMLTRLQGRYFGVKQVDPYSSLEAYKSHIDKLAEIENEAVIFPMRNNLGRTLLHEAVNRLDVDLETFTRMVALTGDINATDVNGNNILMTAERKRRDPKLIELLTKSEAKIITIGDIRENRISSNETPDTNEQHDTTTDDQSTENINLLEPPACKLRRI